MSFWDENFPEPTAPKQMPTGPVTSNSDPRLSDPAHGNDPEVLDFINHGKGPNTVNGGPAPAPATDPTRDAVMKAFAAKGIQPRDEADIQYWIGKINGSGGMSDAGNASYWTQRMGQGQGGVGDYQERPEQGSPQQNGPPPSFNGDTRTNAIPGSGFVSPNPNSGITATPTVNSYQPPTASAFVPYNPGPAPTPIAFHAPTAEEARNTPGYQDAIYQADQGIQRSAVAKSGLSGGLLKDLSNYNIGAADQNYQNVYGNAFNANQALNANNLNAYNATTNANLGAGNLNLAGSGQEFQQNYIPAWNAYLSNVGQGQFQQNFGLAQQGQNFGQNLATNQFNLGAQNQGFNQWLGANQFYLGKQNQGFNQDLANRQFNSGEQNKFWNQGFQSNLNNYNQWDNNQKTAFDQWYKQAQLGNPGNPYA